MLFLEWPNGMPGAYLAELVIIKAHKRDAPVIQTDRRRRRAAAEWFDFYIISIYSTACEKFRHHRLKNTKELDLFAPEKKYGNSFSLLLVES